MTTVLEAYTAAARGRERDVALGLTRTRSRAGRAVLAPLVLAGSDPATLEALAVDYLHGRGTQPQRADFAAKLDATAARQYAYVTAAQRLAPSDLDVARALLSAVVEAHGEEALGRADAELLLQLALQARDFATAEHVLATAQMRAEVRQLAVVDAANPWIRAGRSQDEWLDRLNSDLYRSSLLPVALRPHGPTAFDRLTAGQARPVSHERRITVIMSAYDPGHHLLTAVRSVIEQTWQNFELLVVDDASPAPTPGVLEEVERMDPRVRVIRKRVNGGTYRARNTALAQATGDFFTCLDSDDWAHPQRLEMGVRRLLADPTLMATRGFGVRATPDMELSRVGRGGRIAAASSLMVRTFPGLNRLGFFDPVRKAADNEYALRLEAAYGGVVLDLPRHPLTVLLSDDDSLSASDFAPGWRHPARSEYAESQRRFHTEVAAGRRPAFLDPLAPRAFPAPRRWQRLPQDGEPGPRLDLCILADWRVECLDQATLDHAARAAAAGAVVGVVHLESLHEVRTSLAPLAPAVREQIATGGVERVYLDDAREVGELLVADPRPFQFPGVVDVRLRAERLRVWPRPEAQQARHYDRATVTENLSAAFGLAPRWDSAPEQTP